MEGLSSFRGEGFGRRVFPMTTAQRLLRQGSLAQKLRGSTTVFGLPLNGLDSERGNFKLLALYISSILESLSFLGPGC